MSISLLVERVDGIDENKMVPISTEILFDNVLIPIINKYNLEWIPLFKFGSSFNNEDIDFIIGELDTVLDVLDISNESHKVVMSRFKVLKEELNNINCSDVEFYIG